MTKKEDYQQVVENVIYCVRWLGTDYWEGVKEGINDDDANVLLGGRVTRDEIEQLLVRMGPILTKAVQAFDDLEQALAKEALDYLEKASVC